MSVLEEAPLGFAQTVGWDMKAQGGARRAAFKERGKIASTEAGRLTMAAKPIWKHISARQLQQT
jgi:hypothetical protein